MIKLIIIILCLFSLLIFGTRLLIFLYDRISVLSIWNAPVWLTYRTPITVITVVTTVILLVLIASQISKKRDRAEKQFAQAQGWIYTEVCRGAKSRIHDLHGRLEKVCPEKEFSLGNCMRVESGERDIFLFNCRYRVRDWGPKRSDGFGCLIESSRFQPVGFQVDISGRDSLDALLLSNQVNTGDSEFSRKFIVTSKHPATAVSVISAPLQAALLESTDRPFYYREIDIGPGGAIILTGDFKRFKEYLALVDLARQIESAFD